LTNLERKTLLEAYSEYVTGRFNDLTNTIVVVVGFCLGTLSAPTNLASFNFLIVCIILGIFLWLMHSERNAPKSKLKRKLEELEDKYKARKNNEDILDEIRSYDIWKGFSSRVVKHNLQLLFGALFCIYTLFIHALNAGFIQKVVELLYQVIT
jgi:hypothetical protein